MMMMMLFAAVSDDDDGIPPLDGVAHHGNFPSAVRPAFRFHGYHQTCFHVAIGHHAFKFKSL